MTEVEPKKGNPRAPKNLEIARLYLSKHCPHCQEVYAHIKEVREHFRVAGFVVDLRFIEDDGREFWAHNFDAVPTLILPMLRPFKGIAPEWLISEDLVFALLSGDVSPMDVQHGTAKNRYVTGVSRNAKFEIRKAQRT